MPCSVAGSIPGRTTHQLKRLASVPDEHGSPRNCKTGLDSSAGRSVDDVFGDYRPDFGELSRAARGPRPWPVLGCLSSECGGFARQLAKLLGQVRLLDGLFVLGNYRPALGGRARLLVHFLARTLDFVTLEPDGTATAWGTAAQRWSTVPSGFDSHRRLARPQLLAKLTTSVYGADLRRPRFGSEQCVPLSPRDCSSRRWFYGPRDGRPSERNEQYAATTSFVFWKSKQQLSTPPLQYRRRRARSSQNATEG